MAHNVAFYSEEEKCYVCYFRTWHNHKDGTGEPWPNGVRWVSRCDRLLGDEIDRVVSCQGSSDLKSIAGRAVRLRFKVKDADLYSIMFRQID